MSKEKFTTATSTFIPFYKLLKVFGIYPYAIEFHPVSQNFKGTLPVSKLSPEKCGISVIWHRTVFFLWSVHTVFQIYQVIWHLFVLKSESSVILSLTAWVGTSLLGWIIAYKYYIDGDQICRLITTTNTLEAEIYGNESLLFSINTFVIFAFFFAEKYGCIRSSHIYVSGCVKRHRLEYIRLLISMILFSMIGTTVMIMKHLQDPNFPAFLYSVLPEVLKTNVSLAFSFLIQSAFLSYGLSYATQLVTNCLNFCRVLEGFLEIISFHEKDEQLYCGEGDASLLQRMDDALNYYKLLIRLMEEANSIFSTTIAFQFGGYFALGCITAFLPLRYWGVASPLSLLSYVFIFFTLIYIFCRVFPGMGSVFDKSKGFRGSWKRGVAYSRDSLKLVVESETYFKLLRLRLKSCTPLGFKCGNFFYIRNGTMLTFFSAISTYLIIMLQFDL